VFAYLQLKNAFELLAPIVLIKFVRCKHFRQSLSQYIWRWFCCCISFNRTRLFYFSRMSAFFLKKIIN